MSFIATVYDAYSDWGEDEEFNTFTEVHERLTDLGFAQESAEFGHDCFFVEYARDQIGCEPCGATAEVIQCVS